MFSSCFSLYRGFYSLTNRKKAEFACMTINKAEALRQSLALPTPLYIKERYGRGIPQPKAEVTSIVASLSHIPKPSYAPISPQIHVPNTTASQNKNIPYLQIKHYIRIIKTYFSHFFSPKTEKSLANAWQFQKDSVLLHRFRKERHDGAYSSVGQSVRLWF